jgi:hypothetical protein
VALVHRHRFSDPLSCSFDKYFDIRSVWNGGKSIEGSAIDEAAR